ncbi:HIRAN domain-containing protein [Bathymodiolus thermophilus thioautotrophic gill symbiont]|uniref:HIRAN domain-containing protein n=1 Tax=Bathymodiolus thermophilus thioautotrophic gill symbiont TaxID=2360 RepID=A0A1J5TU12_9GAMM|nr:HIRAN domain-containing protein [Bathymodiolus thermophilus thioautotrophic gill symbiont]OIR24304.1 hypothetical protein BGC33_10085 [Bathymodiolus thermophilus thioautotrophic gill symbiont]
MCQELILSWQNTKNKQLLPIGRFSKHGDAYSFIYTKGAKQAREQGFIALASSMQDFNTKYFYNDIFPILKNRILNKSRPDRKEFLKWLNIDSNNSDFEELAKTGGVKATDNLFLFPVPIKKNNQYILEFFSQGISHLPKNSQKRIEELEKGEKLFFCADLENSQDENAHMLRTNDPVEIVGYCPKYLAKDFKKLFDLSKKSFSIRVKQINKDAPDRLRLLCEITCDWHKDFSPFSEDEFALN